MKYSQIPASEFTFYTRTWEAQGDLKASVIFVHGFAEHVDRYDHVFSEVAKSGIKVFAYDQRGFGQSASRATAGVTGGWAKALDDLDYFVKKEKISGTPQFLWGHSMGGALCLKYALDGPSREQITGFISSAPLIQQHPSARPNFLVLKAGSFAANFLPDQIIDVEVPVKTCTRDPEKIKEGEKDQWLRPFGSLRGVADMLAGGETLLEPAQTSRFTAPLLLCHGTGDIVTYHEASRKFMAAIPSKDATYKEYEDAFHEIHNDLPEVRAVVIKDCTGWILERAKNAK